MKGCDRGTSIMLSREISGLHCPYSGISDVCNAALSSLLASEKARLTFCKSEDYDNCPLFLSKVLRRR